MERASKLILSIIAISLFLGWILEPALVIIGGLVLWFFILLLIGGAEDGNPYRTMNSTNMPDIFEVGRFMKQQKIAKKEPIDRNVTRSFLIAGAMLIIIGILWMMSQGTW